MLVLYLILITIVAATPVLVVESTEQNPFSNPYEPFLGDRGGDQHSDRPGPGPSNLTIDLGYETYVGEPLGGVNSWRG
jgi:hypothetical protein